MDSQKWLVYRRFKPFPLSLGYWLEGSKMEAAEKALARQFDLCTCTTRAELETLRKYQVPTPSDWFPNGVDCDYFTPGNEPYDPDRSEEHTSELQSLMRISYAVFCLTK